jgi:hypothetical protein
MIVTLITAGFCPSSAAAALHFIPDIMSWNPFMARVCTGLWRTMNSFHRHMFGDSVRAMPPLKGLFVYHPVALLVLACFVSVAPKLCMCMVGLFCQASSSPAPGYAVMTVSSL